MALRVLLADESATIKKVIQITLQDFAVELRNVTVGTDVVSVASSFKPDIIFVDILLQKKNGYEVSSDLKSHPELGQTPVILLWNSFMDLDQDKLQQAHADEKLEKPFDAESLRRLVMRFVPKLQSSPIAEHIQPPDLQWTESAKQDQTLSPPPTTAATVPDFLADEPEDFSPMSIQKMAAEPNKETTASIAKFKLDLPTEELGDFDSSPPEEDIANIDTSNFLWGNELKLEAEEEENWQQKPIESPAIEAHIEASIGSAADAAPSVPPLATSDTTPPQVSKADSSQKEFNPKEFNLSEAEIEAIVMAQSREVIERLARKLVPEIAKDIIQKELERLTQDLEA